MCDSNNFHEENNVRDHFPWHLADEVRRRTQGIAGSERKEYLYSPLSNGKKTKRKQYEILF